MEDSSGPFSHCQRTRSSFDLREITAQPPSLSTHSAGSPVDVSMESSRDCCPVDQVEPIDLSQLTWART